VSKESFVEWKSNATTPKEQDFWANHWRKLSSFEDADVINIQALGAVGDGETDNTAIFKKALESGNKIFIPQGRFKVNEPIVLKPNTELFGIRGSNLIAPSVITTDNVNDSTFISYLSISGNLEWNSGKGAFAFSNAIFKFGINGGGRFYATRSIGGRGTTKLFEETSQPIAMYALNVERVTKNPQSYIKNCSNISIFYLKSEASPVGFGVDGGSNSGNTPLSIINSTNIRLYCVNGNVQTAEKRPVIEIVDSSNIMISQIKSNRSGDFPQVREKAGESVFEIPSDRAVALFIRD
jgi:hypothetical protein